MEVTEPASARLRRTCALGCAHPAAPSRWCECVGLLALGSAEAERFYAGMGTLYLGRIADLAAAALVARAG
jgi:uncharacterized protein YigA (DUF484 family)